MAQHESSSVTLAKTTKFLKQREGIDKGMPQTLKIIRYTARLLVALSPPGSEARDRLDRLQSSLGTARKAYRLGKFLQHVESLREVRLASGWQGPVAAVALAGEGLYYFLDQFTWLIKAGVLPKAHEKALARASAWAETVGYGGNISLNAAKVQALRAQERELWFRIINLQLARRQQQKAAGQQASVPAEDDAGAADGYPTASSSAYASANSSANSSASSNQGSVSEARSRRQQAAQPGDGWCAEGEGSSPVSSPAGGGGLQALDAAHAALAAQLRELRYQRLLRSSYILQDLADGLMSLSDLGFVSPSPVALALAGLLSGCVSFYKYWP